MCVNIEVCHCYDVFETQLDAVTLQQNIMMLQAVTMSHMSRCCRGSSLTATGRCSQFPACRCLLSTAHTAPARSRSSELMLTHHRTQSLIQRRSLLHTQRCREQHKADTGDTVLANTKVTYKKGRGETIQYSKSPIVHRVSQQFLNPRR